MRTGDRDVGCGAPALEELSFCGEHLWTCGEVARSTGQWKPQDRSVPGRDKCQLPRAAGVCVLGVEGGRLGGGDVDREASPTLRLVPGHPRWPYSTTAPSWVQGKALEATAPTDGSRVQRKQFNWCLMLDWALGGGAEWGLFCRGSRGCFSTSPFPVAVENIPAAPSHRGLSFSKNVSSLGLS